MPPAQRQTDSSGPLPTVQFPATPATEPRTDRYGRDKRAMAAWVAGIVAVVLVGAVGFAHGKLWDHDAGLRVLEVQRTAAEKRLDAMEQKLDRILERLGAKP